MMRFALAFLVMLSTAAAAEARSYEVDPSRSEFTVLVLRSGLFKFAGHMHEIAAPLTSGEVLADADHLERSSVRLVFDAAALRVTGRGEPAEDVPKVQSRMQGPDVLDVTRYPSIAFAADSLIARRDAAGNCDLRVMGVLNFRGVRRQLAIPARLQMAGDSLVVTGATSLLQSDFGITPISVAGLVKVKDEVTITYHIVAHTR